MKILLCSDGTPTAENAIQLGELFAVPLQAETTLLGIAENAGDENQLRQTLEKQSESVRGRGIALQIVVQSGEPVRQILDQTSKINYDLVIIGARWTGSTGPYWRSPKTYEVIKAILPPVMVAIGDCKLLKRFLVCTRRERIHRTSGSINRETRCRRGRFGHVAPCDGRASGNLRRSGQS